MEIRILTAADSSLYRQIRLEALENEPQAFTASAEEDLSVSIADIEARLSSFDGSQFVIGAFDGLKLVGMAGFYRERGPKVRHKGRIWGVYVTAAARRRGLARRLMAELLDRAARLEGLEQIVLSVSETQTAAAALYRSLGFKSFGREPRALQIGGRYLDEKFMIRFISPALR